MSKEGSVGEKRLAAPTATTLWCCPFLDNLSAPCKSCYNCCRRREQPPCPFFYFCFPCCCCCCRPDLAGKLVDEAETELVSEELTEAGQLHEGAEQEEEEEEEEEGAAAPAAAAKPKARPRPRKHPAAGKKAAKSGPSFFTGKAAGLPPPPREACEGPPPEAGEPAKPVGLGAYLVYTDAEGGKLTTQWSKTPVTGAGILAYLNPAKEIGDFKFEKKSAVEVHATGCQAAMTSDFPADRVKYYEGWASFVKLLSSCGGSLVLLPAAGLEPPPKVKLVLFNKGKLTSLQVGEEISMDSFEALAVLPSNATAFDVSEMPLSNFSTLASAQGVYVSLKK
ncbi:hypothetical protein Efla_000614 [Eimeria flavescens]